MLDLIINNEEVRLLFYAVSLLILTLAAEKYVEKKYNLFEDEKREK